MTEETYRTQVDRAEGQSRIGVIDVLIAELEADDGPNGAALRRALDLEQTATPERIAEIENDLEARLETVDRRLQDLETVDRRLQDLETRLASLESETRGLRSELTAVRDSLADVHDGDADYDGEADIDALADDLAALERTVATAFDAVTDDLESDLERMRVSLTDDISALERRLSALEDGGDGNYSRH